MKKLMVLTALLVSGVVFSQEVVVDSVEFVLPTSELVKTVTDLDAQTLGEVLTELNEEYKTNEFLTVWYYSDGDIMPHVYKKDPVIEYDE